MYEDIIEFCNSSFCNKEIEKIDKIDDYLYLVEFELPKYNIVMGKCHICGRDCRARNNNGKYFCSIGRSSGCIILNKCPVCGKVFNSKNKTNGACCSHKCLYQISLKKWHNDNSEESHNLAIRQGRMNGGKAFQKKWNEDRDSMLEVCSNGGKVGGATTADKGYWKKNLDNSRYWDKDGDFYYSDEAKKYRENFYNVTCSNGGKVAGRIAVESGQLKEAGEIRWTFDKNTNCNTNCEYFDICSEEEKNSRLKNISGLCNVGTGTKGMNDFNYKSKCNHNCPLLSKCSDAEKECLKNKYGYCQKRIYDFNRESFYSKYLELTSVNEMLKDFDKLEGIPGVVDVGFHDGNKWISLDVGQSVDLKQECLGYLKRLEGNKNLTDEELLKENERYSYSRKKYRSMMEAAGGHKIEFVLVARDIETQEEREDIEAQHAHDVKSMFWSPAPGQKTV